MSNHLPTCSQLFFLDAWATTSSETLARSKCDLDTVVLEKPGPQIDDNCYPIGRRLPSPSGGNFMARLTQLSVMSSLGRRLWPCMIPDLSV